MNKIWILLSFLIGAYACSEDNLTGYNSNNYIYFKKAVKDSTIYSFAYDRNLTEAIVNLELGLVGNLSGVDQAFKIQFLENESSAKAGVHFTMPKDSYIVKANDTTGTLPIVVLNQSLDNGDVIAVFELIESSDFKLGPKDHLKARLIITNQLNRPKWWDNWHEGNGLGSYSKEKYQAFIDEMKIHDLTLEEDGGKVSYSQMRALVLQFKRILEERPRNEKDGSLMKVAIKG